MSARSGDLGPAIWSTASEDGVEPGQVQKLLGGLFRTPRPRTFQEVRRNSPHAGEREERLWRQFNLFSRDDHNAIMSAAELVEHNTKRKGKRNGAIGYVGLAVLRYLLRLRGCRHGGRLDPRLQTIADAVRYSRSAVCRALARLKLAGFIDWLRRSIPVEDPEPGGQYVKQTSNAFVFSFRKDIEKMICRLKRRLTPAEASAAAEAARQEASRAMTTDENIAAIADPGLREALKRARLAHEGENSPKGRNGDTL